LRVGDSEVEESSLYSNRRTAGETGSLPYALQAPFLVPEAVAGVLRARRWRHPVWMIGGPGAGAYEVSRALHESGDPVGYVSARQLISVASDLEERVRSALESEPTIETMSLYVERIERQPLSVQERILRWGDEGTRWGGRAIPIRLLAQSDEGFRLGDLLPALRHRLSSLTIPLPPLSNRQSEIPAIALVLADHIAEELRLPEPTIDDAAVRALSERDWPGNLDELVAVITRGLLAAEGARITDFEAARFSRSAAGSRPTAVEAPRAVAAASFKSAKPAGPTVRELEMVIAELAHELKNPMVTIKTFAENLEQLLNDPALREKFVGLTREAVDRMDGFLEELLRFSRYGEPRLQTLSLTQTLAHAIDAAEGRVRERVKTNGLPSKQMVRFDEDQLTFALKSLVRGLCREIPMDAFIRVDLSPEGELVFHSSAAGGMQQKLQSALDHEGNASAPWSLDLIMADALIRRNGGSSRIVRDQSELQVRVSFPSAERGTDGR
jgi:transcriptional regulator of acetoin/glycerol metabolism